jgi:hypothetical protein
MGCIRRKTWADRCSQAPTSAMVLEPCSRPVGAQDALPSPRRRSYRAATVGAVPLPVVARIPPVHLRWEERFVDALPILHRDIHQRITESESRPFMRRVWYKGCSLWASARVADAARTEP